MQVRFMAIAAVPRTNKGGYRLYAVDVTGQLWSKIVGDENLVGHKARWHKEDHPEIKTDEQGYERDERTLADV